MIGARIKPQFEAESRERQLASQNNDAGRSVHENLPELDRRQSRDDAAAAVNVSPRLVESAAKVQKNGTPKLVEMVDAGEVAVSAAESVACLPESEREAVVAEGPPGRRGYSHCIYPPRGSFRRGCGEHPAPARRRPQSEPSSPRSRLR
jgi:hypothetical protein